MKRMIAATTCLLVLAAAVAATADAATTNLTGKSSQGFGVLVGLRDGNVVDLVRLKWRAKCHRKGYTFGPTTTYWRNKPAGPIEQNGQTFSDSGTLRFHKRGARLHYVVKAALIGRIDSPTQVSGVQSVRVRVLNRHNRRVDTCKSIVGFTARG